ncbi:MAG: ChaN family lipoprotein [Capsulimonadales bacterium]|nr:ChaN family lipoprotein [Capsulimonadales bacterium]
MTRRQALAAGAALLAGEARAETQIVWAKEWKIVEGDTGKEIRSRDLPKRLAASDVVFAGEQHDDPETHRGELALLATLHKSLGDRLTLAMEMFERDHQAPLTDYVSGRIDEAAFTKAVRLWKNYPSDYRPMIEFARENRIPVIASNAPQSIVRRVSREGLSALAALSAEERTQIAAYVNAPEGDEYARRFAAVMGAGHGDGGGMEPAMVRRFLEAQCLRDDTMAESIVRELDRGRTVLHINGSFHSDAGLGTAARVAWRRPLTARSSVIKFVPFREKIAPESIKGEAHVGIFVPDRRPPTTR